jgi:hypothetical protein
MTDEPKRLPEDELRDQARTDIETPPVPVPGAETLPDDVPDGRVPEDDGSTVDHGPDD